MLTAPGAVAASRLETETAWAVMVNAGSSITDEEEDLLPEGASEKIYVQVRHWAGATRPMCSCKHAWPRLDTCQVYTDACFILALCSSWQGCPTPWGSLLTTATGPQVRNMVLTRWRQDVTQYLTLAQVRAAACALFAVCLICVYSIAALDALTLFWSGRQLCSMAS